MSDSLIKTKGRSIVLDSLKSTEISAGTQIFLNSSHLVISGSVKRNFTDQSTQQFGNVNSNTIGPNIEISENEILNGLIVIHNGILDDKYNEQLTLAPGAESTLSAAVFGNILLPRVDKLTINVNQSVDFSIINNYKGRSEGDATNATNTRFKLPDNTDRGYSLIGHPVIYDGTSAMFRLFRNNISNYNVYRMS